MASLGSRSDWVMNDFLIDVGVMISANIASTLRRRRSWLGGGNPHVCIDMIDDEPGLPAEVDVFAPFSTIKASGTGLGLPLARRLFFRPTVRILRVDSLVDDASNLHADLVALVGTMLHERYRVDSLLGSGGMGAVFKGHHVGLGRDVAIKILHPEFGRDPSVGKRFEREAKSASRLDHPNCVRVTDFGTTEKGTTYLIMELLTGTELKGRLGQPWPTKSVIATAKQMLAGLEHAHLNGLVHRDLKPENVFITRDYRGEELVKLVDFGIAKLLDEQGVEKLTREGVVFGTPRYMSPEQAAGGKIDERTDLYAAGLIFYEMLAGRGPFDPADNVQLLRMQIIAPPPPLPDGVPTSLARVIEKLLEKSKSDRYASARDVIAALDEVEATPAVVPVPTSMDPSPRTSSSGPQAQRSGAAWHPAAASMAATSSSGNRTLAYADNYEAPLTESHVGVGQPPTGQYQTLASIESVIGGASHTVPIVTMEPIERRPPPPTPRAWLPWAIAGAAIMLVLVGVVAMVTMVIGDDPSVESETPTPEPGAAARGTSQLR